MGTTVQNYLDTQYAGRESSISKDLMTNFKKIMDDSVLPEQDRYICLLAIATSLENSSLQSFATQQLQTSGLEVEKIQEAKEIAALVSMLNTYYKFKGFLNAESVVDYQRAGMRAEATRNPQNGKERLEMMSLAVSVVNGCPACINSHEKALRQLNVDIAKIHDIARLASICKGLNILTKA